MIAAVEVAAEPAAAVVAAASREVSGRPGRCPAKAGGSDRPPSP